MFVKESRLLEEFDAILSARQHSIQQDAGMGMLRLRASLSVLMRECRRLDHVPAMVSPMDAPLSSVLSWMQSRSPRAFEAWRLAFEENRSEYGQDNFRTDSLSIRGNRGAEGFAAWVRPWLHGRVLDIGCGPQPTPLYLETYPHDRCAGIDPLPPFRGHPFVFREAFCESIPWPDASFEAATCATSLDHVFDLDRSLDEICRVLVPGGIFLLWVAFIEGAAAYDVDRVTTRLDRFHLFHFDRPWFYPLILRRFEILEDWAFDSQSHFLCLRPLGCPP
jgi:SAM-dependent methyltransferase